MSAIRIRHEPDPKRPEATDGIIKLEIDGRPTRLPLKGHEMVITVENSFQARDEFARKDN